MSDHELHQQEELRKLVQITERINYGIELEEVLESLYREMHEVIPYNRIGFSLIDRDHGEVVARWAQSDHPMALSVGYKAKLKGSTLETIIETMQPRVINDLESYLAGKPGSESTRLVVGEGMRSSLTCPLIVQGKPVGFVFFSSILKDTYRNAHIEIFKQIAGQLATIVEKGRLYNQLAEQKAIVEKQNLLMISELELAQRVQRSLIPRSKPDVSGLDIAFEYEPARQVGGDILDIIPLANDQVVLFVADAMGHGVQAALVMSVLKAALSSAIESAPCPKNVLAEINRVMARLFDDRFATAACCLIDARSRHAELALAGHSAPLWYKARPKEIVQNDNPSLPLGVDKYAEYESTSINLECEDALIFFTDGIAEAFDTSDNQYGMDRLKSCVLRHGDSSAGQISAEMRLDLDAHSSDRIREDDLAILVVKCTEDQQGTGAKPFL